MPEIVNGTHRLHYSVDGDGPAVVLMHSFLCHGAMWASQVPVLARTHRVINVDLRGHGASSEPEGPFDIYDLVGDVIAVLDHEGVDTACWAGLSIGGMIALRAALTAPERVSGLIVLDSHAGAEKTTRSLKYRAMLLTARLVGLRALLPSVNRLMFGETTRSQRPELVAHWQEEFASVPFPTIEHGVGALIRRDSLHGRLSGIAVPTLVGVGAEDRSLPPVYSQRMADEIPGATLRMFKNAGHLSALEQPDAVTGAMVGFLNALD